ncbi:MAG TPA: class I SAM-dependent methyltransferase [Anaerolineales bacterium]|nr:class I SAM-dependent methyltransferase [Anaerolineales bacterium]
MLESFYDQLSPYYKYLFQDWDASVERQASALDEVIREYFGEQVHSILDAACGIGTQTIGLAQKGYELTASDISSSEIEKARQEASKRNLNIAFGVADMRDLQTVYQRKFDLVIACDNAIPHLLSDDEILQTFEQFHRISSEQGGCMISVRDYATMQKGGRQFYPRHVHVTANGKLIVFDLWEFDGDYYDITIYIMEDTRNPTVKTTAVRGGRYYCITISRIEALMQEAGFKRVVVLKDRIHQPLLVGLKF